MWRREALPINQSADVAEAIVYLSVNEICHGKGLYIAGGTYTELEEKIEVTRELWLGKQNTAWVDIRKSKDVVYGK